MNKYKFSDKEKVAFNYGDIFGYGEVIGVTTTELPILGCFYTIRVHVSNHELPTKDYPFTTITTPEIGMRKLTLDTPRQLEGYGMAVPMFLGSEHIATLKNQYINALRMMPQPEKTSLIVKLAKDLIASKKIPAEVTFEHLVSLIRYTVECQF